MPDYNELMRILSVPRQAGSQAESETREALHSWLDSRGIAYERHQFRLYPNFFIAIGIWLIVSRSLLALTIWLQWGWLTVPIALIGLIGGLVDVVWDIPLVSWIGARQGQNIVIKLGAETSSQEIVLSAHYDSKTEPLDHRQRMFFLRSLPAGIGLTILLGVLGPINLWLLETGSQWMTFSFVAGIVLSLALLFLAWGLGLNMVLGRFSTHPSQGAVDNGAACAILLGLAEKYYLGELPLKQTRLTLALFTGEEVNMQGSRAYARAREWLVPALAVNLEVMAQNGAYVYWEQDGTSLKLMPTSQPINQALSQAVMEVTAAPARPAGPVNSDGYSFLRLGIPATTMGTYDRELKDRGFHKASDNPSRVEMARLPEAVDILARFIQINDEQGLVDKQGGDA